MEHLSKLFGSPARVKLLRLFNFNPDLVLDRESIIERARVTPATASKELAALARIGFITRKTFLKEVQTARQGVKKRRTIGWLLDAGYPYLPQLSHFLHDTLSVSDSDIRTRMRAIGTVKLLVLAGFLVGHREADLDLLLVGDRLNEQAVGAAIRSLEAEWGCEVRYAVLTTDEYLYRLRVRDKLVRDVFDFPHRVVVDKVVG